MLMPILQVNSEDIPEFVIVCGDPKRAETISAKLTNARASSRSAASTAPSWERMKALNSR